MKLEIEIQIQIFKLLFKPIAYKALKNLILFCSLQRLPSHLSLSSDCIKHQEWKKVRKAE